MRWPRLIRGRHRPTGKMTARQGLVAQLVAACVKAPQGRWFDSTPPLSPLVETWETCRTWPNAKRVEAGSRKTRVVQ